MPLFEAPKDHHARRVSLVRLAGEIARAAGTVGRVSVEGEAHRPTVSRGGWVFFVLRDRAAQVSVKVPRGVASRSRIAGGERVCVAGALEWTPDRGELALCAEEVTPVGEGAIAAMIAETRRRLAADRLLDRPRRRLPVLPARIGVVCGSDAAVRKDIESVVAARFPGYPVYFEETTVSGPGAVGAIVDALERVVSRGGVEVVVLARGGGDATSLLPWSSEDVCRAVAAAPVVVVSAIGHEGDRPLCDEVADLRCGTPSIAAAAVVPDRLALEAGMEAGVIAARSALLGRLEDRRRRLDSLDLRADVGAVLDRAAARVERSAQLVRYVHPSHRLAGCRNRLESTPWRRPAWELLARASGRLGAERRHLQSLSPATVLERGYAVVTGPDGAVLRRAASVSVGDTVGITLAGGRLSARVERVEDGGGA
jgi:exodeoxyribonuclease VII large subunit